MRPGIVTCSKPGSDLVIKGYKSVGVLGFSLKERGGIKMDMNYRKLHCFLVLSELYLPKTGAAL